MYVTLDVPRFHCVDGFLRVAAAMDEPGVLHVEVFGSEGCVDAVSRMLLKGPIDAELNDRPIRMRRFVVLHQGDPRRMSMSVHYDEGDRADARRAAQARGRSADLPAALRDAGR